MTFTKYHEIPAQQKEEHLAGALQKEKYPLVNTRELKAMIDRRARDFALAGVEAA